MASIFLLDKISPFYNKAPQIKFECEESVMVSLTEQTAQIVNFRKVKQDFASQALKDGKNLFERRAVHAAKVLQITPRIIKIQAQVTGAFSNAYTCELEIDRIQSEIIDSACDCPNTYDCQHLAALTFFLERELEKLVLDYSQVKEEEVSSDVKTMVQKIEKKVETKQKQENEKLRKDEYLNAAHLLGLSPFFVHEESRNKDLGDLALVLFPSIHSKKGKVVDFQIVLRLPFRSKPFYIQQPKHFFHALHAQQSIVLGGRQCVFAPDSFGPLCEELMKVIQMYVEFYENKTEKGIVRSASLCREGLGELLATAYQYGEKNQEYQRNERGENMFSMPSLFWTSQEKPLLFSKREAQFSFQLDFFTEPRSQLFLVPSLHLGDDHFVDIKSTLLFSSSMPGLLKEGVYYHFKEAISRDHIRDIESIQQMSIPEELFGSFVEHSLPELYRIAEISNPHVLEDIITIPNGEEVQAECALTYAKGELEATLSYFYGENKIPDSFEELSLDKIGSFVSDEGILARNLVEENLLKKKLFHGFVKDEKTGRFVAKNDRKIVEFMTEIVPQNQEKVTFFCPENLQSQFCYDDTKIAISLSEGSAFDKIRLKMKVNGDLKGVNIDYLFDCVSTKRTYIVIAKKGSRASSKEENELSRAQKILVLKLELLEPTLHILDEIGIHKMEDLDIEIPLWTLVNFVSARFSGSMISVKLSKRIKELQEQIFATDNSEKVPMPQSINADFRHYQEDGIGWLYRLRHMGLNGVLADDMGLGKTLQAITAIEQYVEAKKEHQGPTLNLIICPTSLVENWKEEFRHFGSKLKIATCTGTPQERKKLLSKREKYNVIITSYGLVQKDIELYEKLKLGYLILDEAQAIKNRETRNARSVKKIPSRHKLILTGTPLENSLEDLWSLFDFLMPGLLGSFDRFINNYVKPSRATVKEALQTLKKKVTPFVLRRMKTDVLDDLPPISHFTYNCRLTKTQQELYVSYAKSAREQLSKLVAKEGFDKVRLQVLATLTRLKQICCHPAIFAKDKVEEGDSAKYEMLLDLLSGLSESKRKTVVFSQYTKMLNIMRQDLMKMGIKFSYLDGSSRNRMSIVKQFNEDPDISVFLVSLKVGGTGLNLVGADTVIHYDMWWNPAVENQATDRVWRMGQKQAVSAYKLVTLDTIEEKIVALQEKKKNLLHDIVCTDEEVISKLTWDEVLDLLQT